MTMKITIEGTKTEAKFAEPNQSQIFELDKFYRKIFSECIREGIMTEAEAKKRFNESGAWTKDEEGYMTTLMQKIAFNGAKLDVLTEIDDEATAIIELIQEDRSTLFELIGRKTELLSNTAEGMANEQKVFKYISLCLCGEDGSILFPGHGELEKYATENREDFSDIVQDAYALIYNFDNDKDLTEDWAEVKFLADISKKADKEKTAKSKKSKKTTKKNTKKKSTK